MGLFDDPDSAAMAALAASLGNDSNAQPVDGQGPPAPPPDPSQPPAPNPTAPAPSASQPMMNPAFTQWLQTQASATAPQQAAGDFATTQESLPNLAAEYGVSPDDIRNAMPSQYGAPVGPNQPPDASAPPPSPAPSDATVDEQALPGPPPPKPPVPGLPPGYADMVIARESAGDPNAQNPTPGSTSSGLYGFTDPTLKDVLAAHPELAGADKNDPRVLEAFSRDNAATLKQALGREPTAQELYLAHHYGPTGAIQLLTGNAGSSDSPAAAPPGAAPPAQAGAPAAAVANRAPPQSASASLFQPVNNDINDLKSQQAQTFAGLQKMLAQSQQAQRPTAFDALDQGYANWAMAKAAANAGKHATAGGVMFHELPNSKDFIDAIKAGQQNNMAERAQRIQTAQNNFSSAAQLGLGQLQSQQGNVGLGLKAAEGQGTLDANMIKNMVERYKLDETTAKDFGDFLDKAVPDQAQRNTVMGDVLQNSGGSLKGMQLNDLIGAANKAATDRGFNLTKSAAPATSTTGGESTNDPNQRYRDNQTIIQIGDGVKALNATTNTSGPLSGSKEGLQLLSAAKQMGFDATGDADVQAIRAKMINQLTNEDVAGLLKKTGGKANALYETIKSGFASPAMRNPVVNDVIDNMQASARNENNISDQQLQRKHDYTMQQNPKTFDEEYENRQVLKANPPPLLAFKNVEQSQAQQAQGSLSGNYKLPSGVKPADQKQIGGNTYVKGSDGKWYQQ